VIDVHKVPNFVLADALHLPFRKDAFEEVFSRNVMEHVSDSMLFLKEVCRVATEKVTIICPHRYYRHGMRFRQNKAHQSFYNVMWFEGTLKNVRHSVECSWLPKPHRIFPLFQMPYGIKVEIFLG